MYFVDRTKIETTLTYMESLFPTFDSLKERDSIIEDLALERVCYLMIEAIIDVGNSMIDGFIMRDPGSYADIVDILVDERVIEHTQGESLKEILQVRKEIIQTSGTINHNGLYQLLHAQSGSLKAFPENVRSYLENELGPVSAFLPKE
ncbi:DUF86 domain-containing protein [Alkalicoccobacillus gibsonii]|jgi:uncharacterized protein YutE (UPF0331/DUF86 family)|uniref:DUF86 domain-containing protein n=1 Tax=Alkalicoccobacillus gibsonii TaxID=79881 RepID=UPI0019319431|nr:DUF86 domain-containing protein [Alkalicoccobacillus gibsonii]MBM0066237.1 DUF86 domain-containing protein [Alkalicoccobacillus gibsonii]